MNTILYGGNLVKTCQLGNQGKQMLGSGPYEYYIYETHADEQVTFDELRSFTLYLFEKSENAKVTVKGIAEQMMQGDRVQAEDNSVVLTVKGGVAKLLIAGTKEAHPEQKGLFFSSHANLYKVDKPWGHELWINGQHPTYAFKEIYLKAGFKTSLQYHNFKQETNVLFDGRTNLHFKNNDAIKNDSVNIGDLGQVELGPISSIDVVPGILHRLEAITDILLYETSTPHLDDVIRVTDDSKRPHGRIEQEHPHL
jgi:mannose-6-phosphate isomerase